jgi:hypothetical protein
MSTLNWGSDARRSKGVLPSAMLFCVYTPLVIAQSLQIASPADGTTVNPGQSIAVTVNASGTFQQVMILGSHPIGITAPLSTPPYQFTVQIPTDIEPGLYSLTADGFTKPGNAVYSNPININVERPDAPVSLSVSPSIFEFSTVAQQGFVAVVGTFSDGTTADLTNSMLTNFSSQGNVTIAPGGVVTAAIANSSDMVQVTYGTLSSSIPATVDPPLVTAPPQKTLYASQIEEFTAQPAGLATPTINWSISPNVGTISSTGLYTAPSSVTTQQTVAVTATNAADNTQTWSSTVILNPPLVVNVIPSSATLGASQTQLLGALVLNATITDVVWNLPSGSAGTLDEYAITRPPVRSVRGRRSRSRRSAW